MKIFRFLFILLLIVIGILSVIPGIVQRELTKSFDLSSGGTLFHILAYALLSLLGMINAELQINRFPFWTSGLILIYGSILELIQYFLPYRTFNPYDLLANIIGVSIGCILFFSFRIIYSRSGFFHHAERNI